MIAHSPLTRRLTIGAVAVSAAISLAACGGSSSSSTSSAPALPSVSADPALAAQVPAAIKSAGKITYGTDASYAPNEFIGDDGKTIQGVDIDLGNAIAAKLGLQSTWENSNFDSLIVGVQNGKYGASMSSFTVNPDRESQVNMVTYYSAGTEWAVPAGNPQNINPDDACGKRIAVQKATVQVDDITARSAACTAAGKPAIDIQQYNLQSDATTAVASGKADAMLADSPVIEYAAKQNTKIQALGNIYDSAPYGVVVPKDQTAFATAIQGAVQALIADGSYKAILDKWGVANGAIQTSQVNPSVS